MSLHLSKYHIVGNHVSRLMFNVKSHFAYNFRAERTAFSTEILSFSLIFLEQFLWAILHLSCVRSFAFYILCSHVYRVQVYYNSMYKNYASLVSYKINQSNDVLYNFTDY